MSPDPSDTRGPAHNSVEFVELVGNGTSGGPALVIKAGQYCVVRQFTVQQFRVPNIAPVQFTFGTHLVSGASQDAGTVFGLIEDGRIVECSGGVEIAGNNDLASSSNANWVRRVVCSSISGPAFYLHGYTLANVLVDCEAEANTGLNDVKITGIADGTRIDRLYTESDSLSGTGAASLVIDSDSSVRETNDLTFGSPSSLGDGVAQHVSITNSTFSRTQATAIDAIKVTHSRSAGLPGPRGTVISDCYVRRFAVGVRVDKAEVSETAILLTRYAMVTTGVIDAGAATVIWNHSGTLQLAGHLTFGPTNSWDIGAAAGTKPRDLYLGRDAFIGGRCQVVSGADDALQVANGGIRLTTSGKAVQGVTTTFQPRRMIEVAATTTGEVVIAGDGAEIMWGRPLIPLGAAATASLGKVGGTGPTTGTQDSWMQVKDSANVTFWVPVWR